MMFKALGTKKLAGYFAVTTIGFVLLYSIFFFSKKDSSRNSIFLFETKEKQKNIFYDDAVDDPNVMNLPLFPQPDQKSLNQKTDPNNETSQEEIKFENKSDNPPTLNENVTEVTDAIPQVLESSKTMPLIDGGEDPSVADKRDVVRRETEVSVFEVNIRFIGGLLTLYSFTGDKIFKNKAVQIVEKLLPAFETSSGIPYSVVNMKTGYSHNHDWANGGASILSEFGTLHMEFAYLSEITGDSKYVQKVEKIRNKIINTPRNIKLYPNYYDPQSGTWGAQQVSMGAMGDSFYEYLIKEWFRTGKRDRQAKRMFERAAMDIVNQLLLTSTGGLLYFSDYNYGNLDHRMQHLACFSGGMFGLASLDQRDVNHRKWMSIGEGITNTCHEAYNRSAIKLGPENFNFDKTVEAVAFNNADKAHVLRPETYESYFIMWRLTHDQKYRDWGWEAIQALEKYSKVKGGYSGLRDVYNTESSKDDIQPSFFLAESLKYLYLLFSNDDLISLDQWVFNTEAHPLPIRGVNPLHRGFKKSVKIVTVKDNYNSTTQI